MTTEEHLDLILTFCRSRLALAEKRTPGPWRHMSGSAARGIRSPNYIVVPCSVFDAEDAAFIASCAGAAEAGWRATIAAIEQYNRFCGLLDFDTMQPLADAILAAYPLELLQPTT